MPPNLISWPVRGRTVSLNRPAGDLVAGIADLGAVAVLVVVLRAVDRAAEHIDIGIDAHAAERRAEAAIRVGAVGAGHVDAPASRRDARTSWMSLVRNDTTPPIAPEP